MEELEDAEEDAEEEGDLQDDFVLEAMTTQEARDRHGEGASGAAAEDCSEGYSEECSDDPSESNLSEVDGLPGAKPVGSIASTYWRPERHDRNDALSMIDER